MRRRQGIVEKFSTFLAIQDGTGYSTSRWETEPKLGRNIKNGVEVHPAKDTGLWAQHWLQQALAEPLKPLAKGHISAYLEEACYYIATTTARKFTQLEWRDCFQVARIAAANPAKLFKNYDTVKGASVSTYGQFQLSSIVLDTQISSGARSETGLLRSLTEKKLKDDLLTYGLLDPKLSRCVLAWQCFKEIYTPTKAKGGRHLEAPNTSQLESIAQRYSQLQTRLFSDLSSEPTMSASGIQSLLKICIEATRRTSGNLTMPSFDDPNAAAEPSTPPAFEALEAEAQNQEWQQIKEYLSAAFMALTPEEQIILKLWHGLELNQADIANILKIEQQYQLSRQIKRLHIYLLKNLAQWSTANLGTELQSEEISQKAKQMDIWLSPHCKEDIHIFLQEHLNRLTSVEVDLVRLTYIQELDLDQVADRSRISKVEVTSSLDQVTWQLQASLIQYLESSWQITLNGLSSTNKAIANFVKDWLTNSLYKNFR
ncbi:MAG: hypothetical protein SGI87_14515 [Flavobacteriales bacterium]|nr:hypothetical protein [Flavobacteriales bacterium]